LKIHVEIIILLLMQCQLNKKRLEKRLVRGKEILVRKKERLVRKKDRLISYKER